MVGQEDSVEGEGENVRLEHCRWWREVKSAMDAKAGRMEVKLVFLLSREILS